MGVQDKVLLKLARGQKVYPALICLLAAALIVVLAVFRYKEGEYNFRNYDADWHVLLTLEAYDETPASEHLFLPIVTLGEEDNKFIPWGSTAIDRNGNYYYTSFSSAGFFAAWLFMKLFHLPIKIKSLYIFNTVLFLASAMLWVAFLWHIYKGQKARYQLLLIGLVTYVMSPELLHSMGIIYWHQSLMQVTLLAQILAFLQMRESGSKRAEIAFYLLALANPYIEWTGYVANVGFALAELAIGGKKDMKKAFGRVAALACITVLSAALFLAHFLLRVTPQELFRLLFARFEYRNFNGSLSLVDLFTGYLTSFRYLWALLLILAVWNIATHQCLEFKRGLVLFLLAFPLAENIVMKQHAIVYSFDRMKVIWLLSFLICELSCQILDSQRSHAGTIMVSGMVLLFGMANVCNYPQNSEYSWPTVFQADNQLLADYIQENYPNSAICMHGCSVRGYLTLLMGQNLYETTLDGAAQTAAARKGNRYAIDLYAGGGQYKPTLRSNGGPCQRSARVDADKTVHPGRKGYIGAGGSSTGHQAAGG